MLFRTKATVFEKPVVIKFENVSFKYSKTAKKFAACPEDVSIAALPPSNAQIFAAT